MREKIIIGLAAFSGALLAWNMNTIFTALPDELNQGAIYRIIYFHVPANICRRSSRPPASRSTGSSTSMSRRISWA